MRVQDCSTIKSPPVSEPNHHAGLSLADGTAYDIRPGDELASFVVMRLIEIMQLRPLACPARRLFVFSDSSRAGPGQVSGNLIFDLRAELAPTSPELVGSRPPAPDACDSPPCKGKDIISNVLSAVCQPDLLVWHLMRLSQFIALQGEHNGALLLHGALAEKQGCGVILAGPGGVGKTTTSRRMRPPWCSLCDDTTLVVRDQGGSYWAHPWPTWSNFMFDGPGGTWDIQYAVPLLGIFFLAQAHNDELEPMGMGQATCLLTESVEQASRSIFRYLQKEEVRSLRMQRFDNICALAEAVSCYRLRLSLGGAFWQEMERALAGKWGGIY